MKKKIINIMLVIVLTVMSLIPVYAMEVSDSNKDYMVDNANLLSESEEDKLEEKLKEISTSQNLDVVIVTTDSLEGNTATAYADDYFDYNGYGEDGILFLISMEYRDWAISTTGFGIQAFTDAGQEYIINEIKPCLSDDDFYNAFNEFADLCDDFISEAKSGEAYDSGNLPKKIFQPFWMLVALVIGFVVAIISTSIAKSKLTSVRAQAAASNYVKDGSLNIRVSRDLFLYRKVDRRAKPKQNSGSSTHIGSSGRSHGGSSGKF